MFGHLDQLLAPIIETLHLITCWATFFSSRRVEALKRSRELANFLVEDAGEKISFWNLLCTKSASLLKEGDQFKDTFTRAFEGKPPPLKNGKGIKAFAVCSLHEANKRVLSPFLLRTYEPPNGLTQNHGVEGTCNLDLATAMHATASVPGVVDRVRIEHNSREITLADGGFVANTPTALAILEARYLWPNRQVGTVLSIGLDPSNTVAVDSYRSIDVARLHSPSLHYHRLIATDAMRAHSPAHFAKEKTDLLEQNVRNFLRESETEQLLMQKTLDLLYKEGENRRNDPKAAGE